MDPKTFVASRPFFSFWRSRLDRTPLRFSNRADVEHWRDRRGGRRYPTVAPGSGEEQGKVFRGLSGLFYLVAGIWVVAYPVESEISLTLFAGLLLIVEGVMELASSAASQAEARGLVLADGLVTALLGGLLVAEWPSDSLWAVGTLFGISLFFTGFRLLTAE